MSKFKVGDIVEYNLEDLSNYKQEWCTVGLSNLLGERGVVLEADPDSHIVYVALRSQDVAQGVHENNLILIECKSEFIPPQVGDLFKYHVGEYEEIYMLVREGQESVKLVSLLDGLSWGHGVEVYSVHNIKEYEWKELVGEGYVAYFSPIDRKNVFKNCKGVWGECYE